MEGEQPAAPPPQPQEQPPPEQPAQAAPEAVEPAAEVAAAAPAAAVEPDAGAAAAEPDAGAAAAEPTPEPAGPAEDEISDEEVKQRLHKLLAESDLNETTEKMLRKQLEQQLGGKSLASKKALIRSEVVAYLAEHQPAPEEADMADEGGEDEGSEPEDDPKGNEISDELREFLKTVTGKHITRIKRPRVVKLLWKYIHANSLQNPEDKREILVDDAMGRIFTPPVTMFSMNAQLSNHVYSKSSSVPTKRSSPSAKKRRAKAAGSDGDDGDSDPPSSDDERGASPPSKRAKPAAQRKSGGAKKKNNKNPFTKDLRLSDALAAVTGRSHMSRPELTSWIYAYANEHNLKDPSDKRYCLADEALQEITGEQRFLLFGSQKFFKEHLFNE